MSLPDGGGIGHKKHTMFPGSEDARAIMKIISLHEPAVTSFSVFFPRLPGVPPGSTLPACGTARTEVASAASSWSLMVTTRRNENQKVQQHFFFSRKMLLNCTLDCDFATNTKNQIISEGVLNIGQSIFEYPQIFFIYWQFRDLIISVLQKGEFIIRSCQNDEIGLVTSCNGYNMTCFRGYFERGHHGTASDDLLDCVHGQCMGTRTW
jgi:hypothetical protein